MFSRAPATGWADQYEFVVGDDGALKRLAVVRRDIGRFSYSPNGEFLEEAAYRKATLFKGAPENRVFAAGHTFKVGPKTAELAQEVIEALDTVLKDISKDRKDFIAQAQRTKGEALEVLGKPAEAILAYEQALAANPKIGLVKRVAKMKKDSAAGG